MGPLFQFQSGTPLTTSALVSHLQSTLCHIGIDSSPFTGHSFCIGHSHHSSSMWPRRLPDPVSGEMEECSLPGVYKDSLSATGICFIPPGIKWGYKLNPSVTLHHLLHLSPIVNSHPLHLHVLLPKPSVVFIFWFVCLYTCSSVVMCSASLSLCCLSLIFAHPHYNCKINHIHMQSVMAY